MLGRDMFDAQLKLLVSVVESEKTAMVHILPMSLDSPRDAIILDTYFHDDCCHRMSLLHDGFRCSTKRRHFHTWSDLHFIGVDHER